MSNGPQPLDLANLPVGDIFPIEPTPEVTAAVEEESEAYVTAQRWKWLESTYELQGKYFNTQLPAVTGTDEFANYVVMNHSALVAEAGELLAEFGWKTWAEPRGWVNRANALKEAVDVAHFLANILCAIGVTDQEWEDAYQKKQEVNRRRQREGYDGVTGKCPTCRRAYDDGIACTPTTPVTVTSVSGDTRVTYHTEHYCAYV